MAVWEIDANTLQRAREVFLDYKNRGVVLNGDFDDMAWTLTDQTRNVGLTLLSFEGGAQKPAMKWIGCSYRQYIDCVKSYLVLNLGEVGLATMQDILRAFNKLAISPGYENALDSDYLNHIVALLQLIPGGNEQRDHAIEVFEERMDCARWKKKKGSQRRLADFTSYLRFHDVLQSFWQKASDMQKLFYFPIYFWWNLTAILPLRPMEFLLTPMECLRTRDGVNTLTVRRTKLKGGMEKIRYQVSEDYELKEYAINANLASELRGYISATASCKRPKLDTLFVQEPHFAYLNAPIISTNKYYTYACMNNCLRVFYSEIIEPSGENVSRIRLGDTRHLAMTNLIISGGSPMICMELAGHANIDVSAHYYANISNLIECVTLELYRKTKKRPADMTGISKYPLSVPDSKIRVADGWCSSEVMRDGRVDDCLKVLNNNCHIGDCRYCGHYQPDNPGVNIAFYDERTGKDQVDADSRYLIRMIELVRRGLGHEEDIGSALLRLQHSSDHYGKCLWEKYATEGNM